MFLVYLQSRRQLNNNVKNIPVPDYRNDVKVQMCNRRKPQ